MNSRVTRPYSGRFLRVERAPESTEVLWQNLHYSFKQQLLRKSFTLAVTLVLLGITFGIMYGLKYVNYIAKKNYKQDPVVTLDQQGNPSYFVPPLTDQQTTNLSLISIAIYAVSRVMGRILGNLLAKLTAMEKSYTVAELKSSCVKKSAIVTLFD